MAPQITLSQACEGLIYYKSATGKSIHTTLEYRANFKKLAAFFPDDPPLSRITRAQLIRFFAYLQTDYRSVPDGAAPRGEIKLSQKTILNIHTNLSALWTWAVAEGYLEQNIVRTIDPPEPDETVIEPFTYEEIRALLKACDQSHTWKTRQLTANHRPTALRDRLIILLLLDTGMRASELCAVTYADVNLSANSIKVHGKGRKDRLVYFGRNAAHLMWTFLTPRLKGSQPTDPIFTVQHDRPLTRNHLLKLLTRLGERAGVPHVHPHRFRHTFAITYLRNHGGELTLQTLLGHSDLTMVKRYARLAQVDVANAHKTASPVDNWKL